MKFIVDENLPPRLAKWLVDNSHDAIHIAFHIRSGTGDEDLVRIAVAEDRVIVTKDGDFDPPRGTARVLHLRIGNCSTRDLLFWLEPRFQGALERLARHEVYVELV